IRRGSVAQTPAITGMGPQTRSFAAVCDSRFASPIGSMAATGSAALTASLSAFDTTTKSGPCGPPFTGVPASTFERPNSRRLAQFIANPPENAALERQTILQSPAEPEES